MKITKQRLKEIIKEEFAPLLDGAWPALDQAFVNYLEEYKRAAGRAQGEEELNALWDHTTAQIKELINEESFRAHGRMSAGTTASRPPRKFRE